MTAARLDSFGSASELNVGDRSFTIYRLDALKLAGFAVERLPYSLRILLETCSAQRSRRVGQQGRY